MGRPVSEVLASWRAAERALASNPTGPQREAIEAQIAVMRALYKVLTSETIPTTVEQLASARERIAQTDALLRRVDAAVEPRAGKAAEAAPVHVESAANTLPPTERLVHLFVNGACSEGLEPPSASRELEDGELFGHLADPRLRPDLQSWHEIAECPFANPEVGDE